MKKLISCLLAVLLVCSLMSMTVFAADTTYRPVGNENQGITVSLFCFFKIRRTFNEKHYATNRNSY